MTTTTRKLSNIEVLNRLVKVGPAIINHHTKPGPHCVMAASLGQMVLARFKVTAEPFPAEVVICNQAWVDWGFTYRQGGREEQLRRGAYLLSNSPSWNGDSFKSVEVDKPWDGHLALRVANGARPAWLLDLDLGSFNRPTQNIHLPGGLLVNLSEDDIVSGVFDNGTARTHLTYKPLVAPYRDDYQTAKDWVQRARFVELVDELEAAIRA